MDTMEGGTFGVANCDFNESDEKPWEVGFKKGDVLKLIDCVQKNWWKVEVNGRQGYVPAEHVTVVKFAQVVEIGKSQFEQSGLAQQVNKERVKPPVNTSKRTREEELNSHTDESSQTGSARRSARIEASAAKRLKTGLTESQRLEVSREEPQDLAKFNGKTTKVNKEGSLVAGPSYIVKSVGLNKVSVFPYDEAVFKIEKVEPPDEESESTVVQEATSSVSSLQLTPDPAAPSVPLKTQQVSTVDFDSKQADDKISETVFETRLLKEEGDLEDAQLSPLTKETIIPGFRPKEPSPVPNFSFETSEPGVSPSVETAIFDNSVNVSCVLFAQVWEILVNVYYQTCSYYILKNSLNEVLKLRLVCQNWLAVIDKFYENLSCNSVSIRNNGVQSCEQSKISALNPSSRNKYDFRTASEIQRFLNHFHQSHSVMGPVSGQRVLTRNPFLGRCIYLSSMILYTLKQAREFMSEIKNLLDKFGTHLWACSVSIYARITPRHKYLDHMVYWLALMPNLKYFYWREISWKQKPTFNNRIVARSLKWFQLKPMCLRNLRELKVTISVDIFNQFEKRAQSWQLETIQLELKIPKRDYKEEDEECVSWPRVCRLLERWKKTLRNVTINFPPTTFRASRQLPLRLDLPSVTHLKLVFTQVPISFKYSLDFLYPMRASLECLHVEYSTKDDIQKFGLDRSYRDRVNHPELSWVLPSNRQLPLVSDYNSNIWNVFLKLDKVSNSHFCMWVNNKRTPVTEIFSRDEWLARRQANEEVVRPLIRFETGDREYDEGDLDINYSFYSEFWEEFETELDCARFWLQVAWVVVKKYDLRKVGDRLEEVISRNDFSMPDHCSKEGIFFTFRAYILTNYMENDFSQELRYTCGLCESKPKWSGFCELKEHFWGTHFIFGATYRCDYKDCDLKFPTKYDVVQHRMIHGEKHMKEYYELEAEPLQNLEDPEMRMLFNWIHVYSPEEVPDRFIRD